MKSVLLSIAVVAALSFVVAYATPGEPAEEVTFALLCHGHGPLSIPCTIHATTTEK